MMARVDSGSDNRNQRGAITLHEIRQQPELWPTTLERVASSTANSFVKDRAAVICGAGTNEIRFMTWVRHERPAIQSGSECVFYAVQ